jgi:sugar phosphate isomerase/epimerase
VKLAFSTLACPQWSARQSIDQARALGYDGIEWRLVEGRFIDEDFPIDEAHRLGRQCTAAGLRVAAVDSSIDLAAPWPERERILARTRQMLRVAGAFGADFLRVFPGAFPPERGAATWLRDALEELRPTARETGVLLALELHDSRDAPGIRGVSCSKFLAEVFTGTDIPEAGVQWDLGNPYLEGEQAGQTWTNIRPWLLYLQVKDMLRTPAGWSYVPMGQGDLPVRDVLRWIGGRAFDGWVSFEWEKYWNPEIAEPEEVLPQFVEYMSEYVDPRTPRDHHGW